ncbi:MAG: hypothetical protein ACOYOS_11985 [Syntrophales bacterium]
MSGAIIFVEADILRFDGEFADPGNGVTGIDAQVRQDLVNLGGINLDGPSV